MNQRLSPGLASQFPIDLAAFVHLATHQERFWLELVCAPRGL